MPTCVYCGQPGGKRSCPAFSDWICPSCCGQHRGIDIDCPTTCRYFRTHERYQKERTTRAFDAAWQERLAGFARGERQDLLDFLAYLVLLIYGHYRGQPTGRDRELLEALGFLARRFRTVALVETPPGELGRHLVEGLQAYNERYGLPPEEDVVEAVQALLETVKAFSDGGRRALQGLLGHAERHFRIPEELRQGRAIEVPRIITPEELSR